MVNKVEIIRVGLEKLGRLDAVRRAVREPGPRGLVNSIARAIGHGAHIHFGHDGAPVDMGTRRITIQTSVPYVIIAGELISGGELAELIKQLFE